MSTCPTYTPPIRSRRRLMRVALEDEYGLVPTSMPTFSLYDELFPMQPAITTASREEDGALVGEAIPLDAGYTIQGSTFVHYFGGTLPDWTRALELAGCPLDIANGWGRIVFAPGRPRSGTVEVVYGSRVLRAAGARSTCTLRAEVGGPIQCEFSMRGNYSAPETDTGSLSLAAPEAPPLFLGIDFGIVNERTGTTVVPIVKSMSIDVGAALRQRDDDRGESDQVEIALEPLRAPLWETVVEANDTYDWETQFRRKDKFALYLTMYDTFSKRMMVCTPLGYTAQLNAVPTFGDMNGVTVQALQFKLREQRFIEVELF